jgi:hypothetical protein
LVSIGYVWVCYEKENEHGTSIGDLHGFTYYKWRQTAIFHSKRRSTFCHGLTGWSLIFMCCRRPAAPMTWNIVGSRNGGSTNGETAAGDTW